MTLPEEEAQLFFLKYERLPNFCYSYGLLGHILEECENEDVANDEALQFGNWLRAKIRPENRQRSTQMSMR